MWVLVEFIKILLLPFVLIALGIAILNGVRPKKNSLIGYRTPRSMRCVRSWSWAQGMMGEYFLTDGAVLAVACPIIIAVLLVLCRNIDDKTIFSKLIVLAELFSLTFVVMRIEINLKREHDRWEVR